MIELRNVTKKFNVGTPDETTLFDNFQLHVSKGEFVSIVGSHTAEHPLRHPACRRRQRAAQWKGHYKAFRASSGTVYRQGFSGPAKGQCRYPDHIGKHGPV